MGGQSRPSLRNGSFTLMGEPACLMSIGQTVQQLRVESGFSQAQLADRAHITLRALCNVEDGKTARPRTIERIARALGLTPMQLYERAAAERSGNASLDRGVERVG